MVRSVFNGDGALVFDGNGTLVFNGGAVSLDSQGCKPLVGVTPTAQESRSDGIGSRIGHIDNATAPPFNACVGEVTRGSHPGLSNDIAPRFKAVRSKWELIPRPIIVGQQILGWSMSTKG